jgi:hypothetical protein
MKLTVHPILALLTISLLAGLLVACGGGSAPGAAPTQTPIFVVITDTPHANAEESPEPAQTEEPAEPADEPAGSSSVEPELVPVPTPFLCKAEVVQQTYERGVMFWVGATIDERCKTEHDFEPGSGDIWVAIYSLDGNHEWLTFTDDWVEGVDAESDEDLEAPEDLLQPIRGFGKVWREGLTADQVEALGWATAGEFKYVTDYRYDAGGFLNDAGEYVPRPGMHRLVALGGEQYFFDETSGTVFFIPADD